MAALPIVCPAAQLVQPADDSASVICGVLEQANAGAHVGGFRSRGQVPAMFSGTRDAGTVANFCCGPGVPGSLCSYQRCAIWRAQRQADWQARALRDDAAHRPPPRTVGA